MKRIWYGIGFSIFPFLSLMIGYLNVHPELYRSLPQESEFSEPKNYPVVKIGWSEEDKKDPPIQFVSSNHKPLRLLTEVKNISSFWDLWNTPKSELEYRWTFKVKNLREEKRSVTVTYKLVDEFNDVLSKSKSKKELEPGETVEISHKHRIAIEDVIYVKGSSWSVSNKKIY